MAESFGLDGSADVRGDELEVIVDGQRYTGWQEVSVARSVDTAAGTFKVTAVPTVSESWPIRPLQAVTVKIGGTAVVTGFVDSLRASSTDVGRRVEVSGRDRAADLVDSSAIAEPGEWRGLFLHEIARELADPFGVKILRASKPSAEEPFPVFALNPGETAWTAIERAARMRGVLVFSDGLGNLVIEPASPAGTLEAELVEGGAAGNIFETNLRWTLADRFQIYTVKGQGQGSDASFGAAVAEVTGRALDLEIDRGRQLLIIAEGQVSTKDAEDRAQWEAAVRRARSLVIEVKVPGWRQGPVAGPWPINRVVHTRIPSLAIEGNFLIKSLRFERSGTSAAVTTLSLVPEDALEPQPEIPATDAPFEGILDIPEYDEEF